MNQKDSSCEVCMYNFASGVRLTELCWNFICFAYYGKNRKEEEAAKILCHVVAFHLHMVHNFRMIGEFNFSKTSLLLTSCG